MQISSTLTISKVIAHLFKLIELIMPSSGLKSFCFGSRSSNAFKIIGIHNRVFLPAPSKFFLHLQTFFKFPKNPLTI